MADFQFYAGNSKDVVLIVAGIHESEQSGVEIACWVKVLLDKLTANNKKPEKSVLVIADVDPERGKLARGLYNLLAGENHPPKYQVHVKSKFREVMESDVVTNPKPPSIDSDEVEKGVILRPNRMFPAPGTPRQLLGMDPEKIKSDYMKLVMREKGEIIILYLKIEILDFWPGNQYKVDIILFTAHIALLDIIFDKLLYDKRKELSSGRDDIMAYQPIVELMKVIEDHEPIRIVSCHGMIREDKNKYLRDTRKSYPGIFVDPRYSISAAQIEDFAKGELKLDDFDKVDNDGKITKSKSKLVVNSLDYLKFTADFPGSAITKEGKDDDALALKAAQHVFDNKDNAGKKGDGFSHPVAGNWLDASLNKGHEVVHYHFASNTSNPNVEKSKKRGKAFRATGFSLGDWGPVSVTESGGYLEYKSKQGIRSGAPVFTVEPGGYHPSGAFDVDLRQLLELSGSLTSAANDKSAELQQKGIKWDIKNIDKDRAVEMRTFAEAIIEVICETKL